MEEASDMIMIENQTNVHQTQQSNYCLDVDLMYLSGTEPFLLNQIQK